MKCLQTDLHARTAFLERLEDESPDVAGEVKALLSLQNDVGFLDHPAVFAFGDTLSAGAGNSRREDLRAAADGLHLGIELGGVPTQITDDVSQQGIQSSPIQFGRFELRYPVGRGGMGTVYYGIDLELRRPVAIKIPRLDLLGDEGMQSRFLREARVAAQLDHPNLVRILEVGRRGPWCYLVSQWCDSGDLAHWIEQHGDIPGDYDLARFMRQLVSGVEHIHRNGILHLDLKPANIMLRPQDPTSSVDEVSLGDIEPCITDFGVARTVDDLLSNSRSSVLIGTPHYMAPEQAESRWDEIGPATDVYAIGVIFFELLVGNRPIEGESVVEIIDKIRDPNRPAVPRDRKINRTLRQICMHCLSHEPSQRYTSAAELDEDLKCFLSDRPLVHASGNHIGRLLKRGNCWLRRRERILQAGYVTLSIQVALAINLLSYPILVWLGKTGVEGADFRGHAWNLTRYDRKSCS
ncbi:MAG: serine/threonine protein kinase, partial [Planctomycetales bacterium]|nr:serine/threonine protein kinase [Planctomycetales bacterium]